MALKYSLKENQHPLRGSVRDTKVTIVFRESLQQPKENMRHSRWLRAMDDVLRACLGVALVFLIGPKSKMAYPSRANDKLGELIIARRWAS